VTTTAKWLNGTVADAGLIGGTHQINQQPLPITNCQRAKASGIGTSRALSVRVGQLVQASAKGWALATGLLSAWMGLNKRDARARDVARRVITAVAVDPGQSGLAVHAEHPR
jgi:hypothetical protein